MMNTFSAFDGKVIKNAAAASAVGPAPLIEIETPAEEQKPKADKALTLVNVVTGEQRLVDQVAVPANTNEEAAVAAHWFIMDLAACFGSHSPLTACSATRRAPLPVARSYFVNRRGRKKALPPALLIRKLFAWQNAS